MHPSLHAAATPDKAAIIMAETGQSMSYRQLDERANRIAHLLRREGLRRGDRIAIFMSNRPDYLAVAWAAQRSGLYFSPISSYNAADDVTYILRDSGANVLFGSYDIADVARTAAAQIAGLKLFLTGANDGQGPDLDDAVRDHPAEPIADQSSGREMLYSSGTTGRPKAIKYPLPDGPPEYFCRVSDVILEDYGANPAMVYLSVAPLYHAAPLCFCMAVQRIGGTVVITERFDAEQTLRAIERYEVTHAQFVPTHFVRMLALPEETRARYKLSSLKYAIHAAAPCPVEIKERMLDWWGPIIYEYYGGSEGLGGTNIGPAEWRKKIGSVGKASHGCTIFICDDEGNTLPTGEIGGVYFSGVADDFSYHNDPEKTAKITNQHGWRTYGDIGRLDEDGYLFLTDRKGYTIISGGVNIYPQEIENALAVHPKVMDAAVFGVPDSEFGERVVAVVQPINWGDAQPETAVELTAWCKERLGRVKTPKEISFSRALPRFPNGKLMKRQLKDAYPGA